MVKLQISPKVACVSYVVTHSVVTVITPIKLANRSKCHYPVKLLKKFDFLDVQYITLSC